MKDEWKEMREKKGIKKAKEGVMIELSSSSSSCSDSDSESS